MYIYLSRGHVSTVRLLRSDPRSRATYALTNSSSREVLEAVRGVVTKAHILKKYSLCSGVLCICLSLVPSHESSSYLTCMYPQKSTLYAVAFSVTCLSLV